MELSVLIVNYKARAELQNCLESLYENTRVRPMEVIVVDNASDDGSVEMLEQNFPEVRVIANQENIGFARANNAAMRVSQGRFSLLLNNDTLVQPGAVDTMLQLIIARDDVGAVGPLLRNDDGTVQISYGAMVDLHTEMWQRFLSTRYESGARWTRNKIERRSKDEAYVDWVSGACLLLRKELSGKKLFFDESFFMYLEDVDLCATVRELGYRVLYTPDAEIIHLKGKSVESNVERVALEYRRSQLYFYLKHYGRGKLRLLKGYLLVKLMLGWLKGKPAQRDLRRRLLALVWSY
jgi:GT2 family glycosyltransferase